MRFLFNSRSKHDEQIARTMVETMIGTLRSLPDDPQPAVINLDAQSAILVAGLLDIGAAPDCAAIAHQMRALTLTHGSVNLKVTEAAAAELAQVIEIGLIRHEAGIDHPGDFVLH